MPIIDSNAREALDPDEACDRPDVGGGVDGEEAIDAVGIRDPGETAEFGKGVDAVRRREVGGKMLSDGDSPTKISRALGVARSTVYDWKAKLAEVGLDNIGQRQPPGVKPCFDDSELKELEKLLRNPVQLRAYSGEYWTLENVRRLISHKLKKDVSLSHVSRLLKKLGLGLRTTSRRSISS